jgi:CRISPR-associated protein Cas1
MTYLKSIWAKDRDLKAENFLIDDSIISTALNGYSEQIQSANKVGDLLQREALLTKQLYRYAAKTTQLDGFVRERENTDLANGFLNHGNYLAYGLAATTLWVLGIPHGFAVMHGKTRRGALVFDIADLIKDAIVLPWAFISAKEKATEQEFRQQVLQKFTEHKALDFMFDQVKQQAMRDDWL